jgi:uncharacterized membrane protein
MKSILTAALVLVVEAGFVLSLAMSPSPAEVAAAASAGGRAELAARHAPVAPAAPARRS